MRKENEYGQLARRLRDGERLFGYFVTTPSTRITHAVARAGCDFIVIDTEHNSLGAVAVHDSIAATAGTGCTPLVRIAAADHIYAKPALDSGASGIFIPHVTNAEQARAAVAAARYPPDGQRGVGPFYALEHWDLSRSEYLSRANEATIVSVLIESREGIDALPEILEVGGIDVVSIARGDLAASVGRIGQEDHPDVLAEVERAEQLVREAGKALGEVARRLDEVESLTERGYQMICLGTEVATLANAVTTSLASARGLPSAGPLNTVY